MKKILVVSICFLIAGGVAAQPKKVLFLGNSYTNGNNVPGLVQNIAWSFGDSITKDQNTPGGHYFNAHTTNSTTIAKINAQPWDYVFLQEQSQIPALPQSITGQDYCMPHSITLNNMIKANNPCTETIFYMTWGRENGDASFCGQHPPVCTYAGMQQELREMYMWMADTNNATVSPVGVAWKAMRDSFPSIHLYSGDGSHANINGSYLAACVHYVTLFQKSCVGSTYIPSGVTAANALTIQTVASNTVLDSMDLWRINSNHPIADFNFSGNSTINFTNASVNGVYYHWNFDDGNTSSLEDPNYTYAANGNYDVELIVFSEDSCFSDTISQTVVVNSVGINEIDLGDEVKIYPNPTKNIVNIVSEKPFTKVEVYDAYGRLLIEQSNTTVDLSHFEKGMYFIQLMNNDKVILRRKIVRE